MDKSETDKGELVSGGEPVAIADNKGITLSMDQVMAATKSLPEEQGLAVRWLFSYMHLEKLTMSQVAAQIKRDTSVISRIFRGTYQAADWGRVVADIQRLKRLVEERATIARIDFVETSISRRMWKVCEWALVTNSVVFIHGDSQIGKTTALEEYARRNNHGQTKLFRMPSNAGTQLMMKEVAKVCFVSPHSCFENLRERVLNSLDGNNLLIVDEVHQATLSYHKTSRLNCLELLREIHDRTKCGLVLCGTNVFRDEVQKGRNKEMLEQLKRRGIVQLQLPSVPPRRDLDAIAHAFGLPPAGGEAEELMNQVIKESGLGKFTKFLSAASRMASKTKARLSWHHFVSAHDIMAKLSMKEAA